jgi:hypothetical protein
MHAPQRHRLRDRPLHRAARRPYREPFRSSPKGRRRIVVPQARIRMHVARNPRRFGRRPMAGLLWGSCFHYLIALHCIYTIVLYVY